MITRKALAILAMIFTTLLLGGLNIYVLAMPSQIEQRIQAEFQKKFNGELSIGRIEMDLRGALKLDDIELRSRFTGELLMSASRVRMEHQLGSLILGDMKFKRVEFRGVKVFVNRQNGKTEWSRIFKEFYADPRSRTLETAFVQFDFFDADLEIHLRDDNVFKDNELQTFQSRIQAQRNPADAEAHVISGFVEGAGWGRWDLAGQLELLRDRRSTISLSRDHMEVGQELKAKFVEDLQDQWAYLNPRGRAKISGQTSAELKRLMKTLDYRLIVDVPDGRLDVFKFPFPVDKVRGRLELLPNRVIFSDLEGWHDETKFILSGAIEGYGTLPAYDIELKAEDLLLSREFFESVGVSKLHDDTQLSGTVDISARFRKDEGLDAPHRRRLDLKIKDVGLCLSTFPYRLEHLKGNATIEKRRDDKVDTLFIQHLECEKDGGVISIHDTEMWKDPALPHTIYNMRITAKNLPVTEELIRSFEERPQQIFRDFEPEGRIDAEILLSSSGREDKSDYYVANVKALDGSIRYRIFPIKLEKVRGDLVFEKGLTKILNVRGENGGMTVSVNGTVKTPEVGHCDADIDITMDSASLTEDFIAALPPKMGAGLKQSRLTGLFGIQTHVDYQAKPDLTPLCNFQGSITLDGNDFSAGLQFSNVKGRIDLEGGKEFGELPVLRGTTTFSNTVLLKREFKDISTVFDYRDSVLTFTKIGGKNFNGLMKGEMYVKLAEKPEDLVYRGTLNLLEMDMGMVSADILKKNPEGEFNMSLEFEGMSSDSRMLKGSGKVKMKEARLGGYPILFQLFQLITLQNPGRTRFKRAEFEYEIKDRLFKIKDINFDSPVIDIQGRGEMDFAGNLDIDLELDLVPEFMDNAPLLGKTVEFVINQAFHQVMGVKVSGNISDPKTKMEVSPGIQSIFRWIFSPRSGK